MHGRSVLHHLHSATTTTKGGLDGNGPTRVVAEVDDFLCAMHELGRARHDRGTTAQCGFARRDLVTHFDDGRWRWTDECDTHVGDGLSEVGVLGEESISGVHGVGTTLADDIQDCLGIEVTLRSRFPAEGVGLVGQAHVQCIAVELGIHGHGGDSHFAGGPDDSHGNFATVGYQDFFEHEDLSCGAVTASNPSSSPIWPIGWTVRHVAETGSTNDDLMAAAHDGAPHRSVIVADFQTAGKGRLDRSWEAAAGTNLLVSLLFRYDREDVFRFARVVALASRAACRAVSGVAPHLKWPNDLVIGDLKLGGLLAVGAPGERFVVVGIGVNVSWAPEGAVCLRNAATTHIDFSPLVLLQHMLGEIDQRLAASDDDLHTEHRSALSTIGRRVRVELRAGEQLIGTAVDVDGASRLVVQDDAGVVHVIDVGDVIHLRAQ